MKIISVTLKNINALKGRWQIDFSQPPLDNAGIFVICGPTGSGKTSILDAITLALYGETDRLQKKNIDNIMTHHTSDCFCEVVFLANNQKFKSHWSIRRSRGKTDGKIQMSKRILYDLNTDEPFVYTDKVRQVQEHIESITGLDYKRFSRSMMLAQGRFAEFLNAPDRERAELLEKMTGTDIYSLLSVKAFEIARQEKDNLREIEAKAAAFTSLSDEIIAQYQKELHTIGMRNKEKRSHLQLLLEEKEIWQRIQKLTREKEQIEKQRNQAHQQEEKIYPDLLRLKRAIQANEFKFELDTFNGLEKQVETGAQYLEKIERQLTKDLAGINQLKQAIKEFEKQLNHAKKEQTLLLPLIDKTKIVDRDLIQTEAQLIDIQKQNSKMAARHAQISDQQKKTNNRLKKIKKTYQEITIWLDSHACDQYLAEHISDIQIELNEIQDTRNQYKDRQNRIQQLIQKKDELQKTINDKQKQKLKDISAIEKMIKQIHHCDRQLAKFLDGQSLDDLENQLTAIRSQFYLLENLEKLSVRFMEAQCSIKDMRKQLKQCCLSRLRCHMRLKKQEQSIISEQSTLKALEQAVHHEMLVAHYSEHRNTLKPDNPCPLCGSCQHPYVEMKKKAQETAIQKEYEKKQQSLDALIQSRESQKSEQVRQELLISHSVKGIHQYQQSQKQFEQEWDQMIASSQLPLLISRKAETASMKKEVHRQLNVFERRYQESRRLNAEKQELNKKYQQKKENDFKRHDEIQSLTFQVKQISNDIQDLSLACDDIKSRGKAIADRAASRLNRFHVSVPEFGKEDVFIAELKKRADQFETASRQSQNLLNDIHQLNSELNQFEIELKEVSQQLSDVQASEKKLIDTQKCMKAERVALLGDKNPDHEAARMVNEIETWDRQINTHQTTYFALEKSLAARQALKHNKQEELSNQKQSLNQAKMELIQQIQPKGFQSIDELHQAMMPADETQRIQEHHAHIRKLIDQATTRLEDIQKNISVANDFNFSHDSLESLVKNIQEHEQELEKLAKQTGSIEQILKEDNRQKENFKKAQDALKTQESQYKRWSDLNYLIGSADGNAFRTFAQGLTLNRLIEYSNRHLKQLSDRYVLQRPNAHSLTLNIMDTYQANTLRPTHTLSGGESFLVSLSMALGLSDLAGNNIQLESLFLDEGFGALDDETLETALNAIERLNHSGKMIGVISHIESLKERIPVHIEVSKIAGGVSRLDIRGG